MPHKGDSYQLGIKLPFSDQTQHTIYQECLLYILFESLVHWLQQTFHVHNQSGTCNRNLQREAGKKIATFIKPL